MSRRRSPFLFASVIGLAACASELGDDAETSDDALTSYRTPDPNNPWTHGVDLSRLAIGEETILPGEEARFDAMADDVTGMIRRLERSSGRKDRGFHAKAHACVRGELRVHVPASLARAKVGVFAEDKTFPTWVRLSNGTGFVQADKSTDLRGVGIKVMNVPGRKLAAGEETGIAQDFLLTNGAITPAADSARFVEFGKALVDARVDAQGEEVGTIEGLLRTGGFLLRPENARIRRYLLSRAAPRVLTKGSLLGEQFWTGGAIAMGIDPGADPMHARALAAAKLTAIAGVLRDGRCVPVTDLPNAFDRDYLRTDLVSRMKSVETCLDIQVQFQADPALQPIEDTSVEWRREEAPFTSIATVVMPKADLGDPSLAKREALCNELSFTPWHTLPEHRPLGNIQRSRLKVYAASRAERGGRTDPTTDELP